MHNPPFTWPSAALPRLMPREVAAYYCGLLPGKFDQQVRDGHLPQSRALSGVALWDRSMLDQAISAMFDRGGCTGGKGQAPDATSPPAKGWNFTVKEVAGRWQCSDQHIYNLVRSGELQAIRLGKSVRISMKAVEEFESGSPVAEENGAPSPILTESDAGGPLKDSAPPMKTTRLPSGRKMISEGRRLGQRQAP